MSTTNEYSGPAPGNVIQAGEIQGDVNFNYAPNQDIGVVLKHEQKEVHLEAGAQEWFYITVINRSDRARHLDFRVESAAAGLSWKIISSGAAIEEVRLDAGEQIQLRLVVTCTATAPMAGSDELKVLVADVGGQAWWFSNSKPILVEPAPVLVARLVPPERRVAVPGWYRTRVELANKGNTPLRGKLAVSKAFDGAGHLPGWLTSGQVRFPAEPTFGIDPGDSSSDCLAEILVPAQGWADRTWRVPLIAEVKRVDMPPEQPRFEIRQWGRLSDLVEWGLGEQTWKRRTLAGLAALVLVVGGVIGSLLPSPGDPAAAPVHAGAATSSSVAPSAPSVVVVESAKMPCDAGTAVLRLHSFQSVAPADVRTYLDFETTWARHHSAAFPALAGAEARYSDRDDMCGPTIANTAAEYTGFIWIGPFPTADTQAMCEAFRKIVKDCLSAQVA